MYDPPLEEGRESAQDFVKTSPPAPRPGPSFWTRSKSAASRLIFPLVFADLGMIFGVHPSAAAIFIPAMAGLLLFLAAAAFSPDAKREYSRSERWKNFFVGLGGWSVLVGIPGIGASLAMLAGSIPWLAASFAIPAVLTLLLYKMGLLSAGEGR